MSHIPGENIQGLDALVNQAAKGKVETVCEFWIMARDDEQRSIKLQGSRQTQK